MVDPDTDSSPVAQSWDTYWQGTGEVGAYSSGGVNHPVILAFWDEFFQTVKQDYVAPVLIDVASGNGAVIACALAAFGDQPVDITCLDVSDAAITNIRNRFPRVRGIVADARTIPLDSGGFDIVTSQFGVEYAGLEAVDEAARLVAAGGQLVLLLHTQAGSIHQECAANLDAILRLQESRFIPYSMQMLDAGFKACRGADRAPYEDAATQLAPALQALESIVMQYGEQVAGDTIARLYSDVDRIHRNIQSHEPVEVLDWLKRMDGEIDAYAGRMSSMCESAINHETFDQICAGFRGRGYTTTRAEPLVAPDQDLPLAWVLIATNEFSQDATASVTGRYQGEGRSETPDNRGREELQAWIKLRLDAAVKELMHSGVVDNRFIEAKPAWVFPFQVLIGKIRKPLDSSDFNWFICGEVPTDHLDSGAASSPRAAARHFAMKWQLEAARQLDLPGQESTGQVPKSREPGSQLADQAEALYALTDDARLWQQQDGF